MKKKILFVVLLVLAVAVIFIVKSGLETVKNVAMVKNLFGKIAAGQSGIQPYPPPPSTLEITDQEINASIDLLCGTNYIISVAEKIGIKNLPPQAKDDLLCQYFDDLKMKFVPGEFSAESKLLKPISGKINTRGKISLESGRKIKIELLEASLNGQSVDGNTLGLLQNTANQEVNLFLDQFKYLVLDKIELNEGKIIITGIFSTDELFCNLGVKSYCAPSINF